MFNSVAWIPRCSTFRAYDGRCHVYRPPFTYEEFNEVRAPFRQHRARSVPVAVAVNPEWIWMKYALRRHSSSDRLRPAKGFALHARVHTLPYILQRGNDFVFIARGRRSARKGSSSVWRQFQFTVINRNPAGRRLWRSAIRPGCWLIRLHATFTLFYALDVDWLLLRKDLCVCVCMYVCVEKEKNIKSSILQDRENIRRVKFETRSSWNIYYKTVDRSHKLFKVVI